METKILFSAKGITADETELLLNDLKTELGGIAFEALPQEKIAFAMDPGVLVALIDLAKVSLPALITTIGAVWAAKIAADDKKKGYVVARQPVVIIYSSSGSKKFSIEELKIAKQSDKERSLILKIKNISKIHLTWEQEK